MALHAGEPSNVASNSNQQNGTINDMMWNIETDKVRDPSLNRRQVRFTR